VVVVHGRAVVRQDDSEAAEVTGSLLQTGDGTGHNAGFTWADGGRRGDAGAAWETVGTLPAVAGTVLTVRAGSVRGCPFVLDAIRFVEVDAAGGAAKWRSRRCGPVSCGCASA